MNVTATEAKNRPGQVLEQAQIAPVFIEKAGRPYSVVMLVDRYDAMIRGQTSVAITTSAQCHERYKDWVDEANRHFDEQGLRNDELRIW